MFTVRRAAERLDGSLEKMKEDWTMMEQQKRDPRRIDRSLSILDRPIADLRVDPNNPRLHTRNQIRQIARSIETFGFNVPVLINGQGQLIAGHGRVLAAQLLGTTHVPTIMLEPLGSRQLGYLYPNARSSQRFSFRRRTWSQNEKKRTSRVPNRS
jgi:ParB-like nuclease family protein